MISIRSIDMQFSGEAEITLFVATDDRGEIVGSAQLVRYLGDGIPQIQRLFVIENNRHHGIADRLMTVCEDKARAFGAKKVGLYYNKANGAVARFYYARDYGPATERVKDDGDPNAIVLEKVILP